MKVVEIYTDGACRGNPGIGGWGARLRYDNNEKKISGGEFDTTNNRMELMAAIESLKALKQPCEVKLHTDSQYVRKGITEWITSWQQRNWKTAGKKPVKNKELWQQLLSLTEQHQIEWIWVKGHAGIEGNEVADELANKGIEDLLAAAG